MSVPIHLEVDSQGIATLTVHRPEVRNALDRASMRALRDVVTRLEEIPDLRAVIVSGADGTFISGGDLNDLHDDGTETAGLDQHDLMVGTLDRLAALPVPVIAAIEGAARGGGCEVALACDLRILAEDATLAFAQVNMAVTPGWGGAGRLFRLVGYSRAMDLLLTGRVIGGEEAVVLGLANYLCPSGRALHMAHMLAEGLADGPTLAVQGIKSVLRGYLAKPGEAARAHERSTFGRLWASSDHAEASAAFMEKRSPDFRGE